MIRHSGPAGDPGPSGNDVFGDDGYERLDSMGEGSLMQRSDMEDDPETVESASSNWDIPGGGDYDAIGAEKAQSYQGLAASRDGERLIAALIRNAWDAEGSPIPCPNISDQFPGLSHDIVMPLGVQNVPVDKISGSATGSQWPSVDDKEGQKYLTHWFNTGTFNDLDPVKVLKVQDTYWVEGDHYRPALLKELDPYGSLKATVTEVFTAKGDGFDSTGTPATDNWYTSFAAKKTAEERMPNRSTYSFEGSGRNFKAKDIARYRRDVCDLLRRRGTPYDIARAESYERMSLMEYCNHNGYVIVDRENAERYSSRVTAAHPDFGLYGLKEWDEDPVTVEMFYSREWRCWAVQMKDANGVQVGDCQWHHGKEYAKQVKGEIEAMIARTRTASRRTAGVDVWMPIPGKEPWEISESEFRSLYPSMSILSEDMSLDDAARYAIAVLEPSTGALYTQTDWRPGRDFHSSVMEDNNLMGPLDYGDFRGFWDGSTFYFQNAARAWRSFQYHNPMERAASRRTATEQPAARMTDWYPRLSDQVVNLGIQQVPVASIQGSAIKDAWPSEDEARGDRLSKLLEEQGSFDSLKPMKMLKVDDTYWAVDGHHRVSLMQKYNPSGTLQALVTERFPQDDSAQPSYMDTYNYTPSGGFDTGGYSMDAAPMQYWAQRKTAGVDVWMPIPGKEPWAISKQEFMGTYPAAPNRYSESFSDDEASRLALAIIDPDTMLIHTEPNWTPKAYGHYDLAEDSGVEFCPDLRGYWDGSRFLFASLDNAYEQFRYRQDLAENGYALPTASRRRQANETADFSVGNASDMPTGMMAFMDDSDGETGWADATVHPNAENREGLEKSLWTEKTASANRNDVLDFDAKVRMGGRRIRLGASEEEIWTRISEIAPELTDEQVAKYQNMLAMSIDPDKVLHAIETDGVWGL